MKDLTPKQKSFLRHVMVMWKSHMGDPSGHYEFETINKIIRMGVYSESSCDIDAYTTDTGLLQSWSDWYRTHYGKK